jgi:hypothetical protein
VETIGRASAREVKAVLSEVAGRSEPVGRPEASVDESPSSSLRFIHFPFDVAHKMPAALQSVAPKPFISHSAISLNVIGWRSQ